MTNEESLIESLPDPPAVRRFLIQLSEKHPSHERRLRKSDALLSDVLTLVAYSPLLASTMLQHPEHILWLQRKRGEAGVRNKEEMLESLARFSLTNSQVEPHILLSRFRRRELLRIYLRDIRGLATIAEITEEISNLADAILEHALRLAVQELANRYGTPLEKDEKGRTRPAEVTIISLGKLGSKELNYSSDIDLLFIYSDEGKTAGVGTRDPITNREYFVKLGESVTKLVGSQAGEGAAYRVDLRLRPHGRVGPLAMSLEDTLRYYKSEAAAWERQVLIRSRSSAGSEDLFRNFAAAVEDSVFSSDGSVEDALKSVRSSKQQIDLENINARGTNVKLGKGGIREIEFVAQALQLAYGGRDRWLRSPHTLISLSRLADRGLLSDSELTRLADGYAFLRQLEHILQMENGLQTHTLPNEPNARELVSRRMRFGSPDEFERRLELVTGGVHDVFRRVFSDVSIQNAAPATRVSVLPERASRIAEKVSSTPLDPESAITNGELMRISPRIAELVTADPELLQTRGLENAPDMVEIRQQISDAANQPDMRSRFAALRKAWHRAIFRILAYDVLASPHVKLVKSLQTELAEASIDAALSIARDEVTARFGIRASGLRFAVMGLGKLGGGGVDYDSDLDLVMIYQPADEATAGGAQAYSPITSKFVEVFVNSLSAMTRNGSLYRVDLRLRPHGKDGPLAISRRAFAEYMRSDSAIWELLAFAKIRGVAGDLELAKSVEHETREIIHVKAENVSPAALAEETRKIRMGLEKSRTAPRRKRDIDIKYGEGGILDIYFATRFLQLRDRLPDDDDNRATDSTLRRLYSEKSIAPQTFEVLISGYELLSNLDHELRLSVGRSTRLPIANTHAMSIIAERMGFANVETLLAELESHRISVRSAFDEIVR